MCPTLCDPMDCSMPGSSVLHYLLEFTQIHVHCVDDVICLILNRPLLLLPSTFPSIRVVSTESALRIRWPKDWSFSFSISPSMNIQGQFPLGLTGLISLLFRGLSRVFSSTTIRRHQFFGTQPSLWFNTSIHDY